MKTIIEILIILIAIPLLPWMLAQFNIFFTTAKTGQIRLIVSSGNFVKGFVNSPEYEFWLGETGELKKLTTGSKREVPWLLHIGIVWIGWIWPFKSVLRFKIDADKLIDQTAEARLDETSVRRLIEHNTKTVDSLWIKIPRPVLSIDVELPDGSKIDMVLVIENTVTNAVFAVMVYQHGNVLPLLDRAVRGAVNDWFSGKNSGNQIAKGTVPASYQELLETELSHGSEFSEYIKGAIKKHIEGQAQGGVFYGLQIDAVGIENYTLSPNQKELEDAVRAKQIEERKAEALRAKGDGERDYAMKVADGEAYAVTEIGKRRADVLRNEREAFTDGGASGDNAAAAVTGIERGRSIGASKIRVYSESGAGGNIIVSDDEQESAEE